MKIPILAVLLALTGCSTIRGSFPLSPAVTDPKLGVWVFIESTWRVDTGVYRCKDDEKTGEPVCIKASWQN